MKKTFSTIKKEFLDFIKGQGVFSLAVGFLLSGAVAKITTAFISDLLNPFIGLIFGNFGSLANASFRIGRAQFLLGHFISVMLDGLVIALVIWFFVKWLSLDQDKK